MDVKLNPFKNQLQASLFCPSNTTFYIAELFFIGVSVKEVIIIIIILTAVFEDL
jgi:hypothetical protein